MDGQPLLHFELIPTISCGDAAAIDSKPIAKVGIRPASARSASMDELILEKFKRNGDLGASIPSSSFKVGIFVYMWVDPSYRGRELGLELLHKARDRCIESGFDYLLIVHDDNGSGICSTSLKTQKQLMLALPTPYLHILGTLIRYYEKCGFLPIFEYLEKGMIAKLEDLRLEYS